MSTVKKLQITFYVIAIISAIVTLVGLFTQIFPRFDWTEFLSVLVVGGITTAIYFVIGKKATKSNKLAVKGLWTMAISSIVAAVAFIIIFFIALAANEGLILLFNFFVAIPTGLAFAIGLIIFVVGKLKK